MFRDYYFYVLPTHYALFVSIHYLLDFSLFVDPIFIDTVIESENRNFTG